MNNALHEHREARTLTQSELASNAGVTRQSINAIERYRCDPSLELAAEFDCRVEALFWLDCVAVGGTGGVF